MARHRKGFVVALLANQAGEAPGAGDVGAFPNVDEERRPVHREGFEARQAQGRGALREGSGRKPPHRIGDGPDVIRRGSAAATEQVHEAALGKFRHHLSHGLGTLVVLPKFVG